MKFIQQIFVTILIGCIFIATQCVLADMESIKINFKDEAATETEAFLNIMFQGQIDFFKRVKPVLPPHTKRVQDIEAYVQRLENAVKERDVKQKDTMWRETFQQFNKSPLLLNDKTETGLSTPEYEQILNDNGLKDVGKNLLMEVAVYVWKMAKVSGKAMEITIDEQLAKLQKENE